MQQQWIIELLESVMERENISEAQMAVIVQKDSDWMEQIRNGKTELTLLDCHFICEQLHITLFRLFNDYNK